ncbi:unnamed protein product [Cylindrotheca closterium]|uniref:Bacterial surface antigen (D15) domain-containing protein n=1 Tax=Cylindrotheca closterium TaxID=2856 RepID=A0AAD2G8N8_9STRA|nr:unnamed protein product [Cylindrotheca closterium]
MLLIQLLVCSYFGTSNAFLTPPPNGPPSQLNLNFGDNDDGAHSASMPIIYNKDDGFRNGFDEEDAENPSDHTQSKSSEASDSLRGGAGGGSSASSNGVVRGAQVTSARVTNFWSSAWQNFSSKVSQVFKSKETKKEEELMEQLRTMPVQAVSLPKDSVVPDEVARMAVKRSGQLGQPLRTDRVQEIAKGIKRWYNSKGYVLHSVTGATLKPETATAIITVEEPKVSQIPVDITVCKEMIVDDETGEIMTFKQYRRKEAARKSFRYDRIEKSDLNTTFVITQGRTSAKKISQAMNLKSGKPFKWDNGRWQRILSSGVFGKVLNAGPARTRDGNVCLQVLATEPPPRHLEYGLGKSLYTGTWEGEIDFEHQNLFGGGETVGLVVRRGTTDAAPSIRIQYKDDKFGLEGGHEMEVFTDYIGDSAEDTSSKATTSSDGSDSADDKFVDYEHDDLFNRRGATFRLKNPIDPGYVRNSLASISAERTSTRTGLHENLASTSLTLGPFRQSLPMYARSSFSTTLTGGTRLGEADGENEGIFGYEMLPYSQGSVTSRQILPLLSITKGDSRKPISLALQHIVATATPNLPRHEAKAMGISAQIRGVKPDGGATSTVKGTAELRIPFELPKIGGDATMLFFGDWFYVQKDHSSPFYSKSSIGVGLRKNVQGLPLKYDVSYTSEGDIKQFFGLGMDFDA